MAKIVILINIIYYEINILFFLQYEKNDYFCTKFLIYFLMNIFIGSLPYSVKDGELQELFEEYGEVSSAKVITDKFTNRSKGFGFVEMPDDEAAQKAINELNGTEIGGRNIVVNKANDREAAPRSNRYDSRKPRY